MSLTDVIGAMRLHLFAEVAFVLATGAFATVLITVFLRANHAAFERARLLPFDEPIYGAAQVAETSHE